MMASALAVIACEGPDTRISKDIRSYEEFEGFFDMYWDESLGRLLLKIEEFEKPFLYQSSLARGVGSNDIGLDRGQLGSTKVVEFHKSGPKVLLIEKNLRFRASSDSLDEKRAVEESFARSVIWGFESLGNVDGATIIDASDFFIRDAHGISTRLKAAGEGEYIVDASRSAIYLRSTKAFSDNSEIEAIVTYTGKPIGEILQTVVADSATVTVHLHH